MVDRLTSSINTSIDIIMTKRHRLSKNPKIKEEEEEVEYLLYLDHDDVLFIFIQILNALIKKIIIDTFYFDMIRE